MRNFCVFWGGLSLLVDDNICQCMGRAALDNHRLPLVNKDNDIRDKSDKDAYRGISSVLRHQHGFAGNDTSSSGDESCENDHVADKSVHPDCNIKYEDEHLPSELATNCKSSFLCQSRSTSRKLGWFSLLALSIPTIMYSVNSVMMPANSNMKFDKSIVQNQHTQNTLANAVSSTDSAPFARSMLNDAETKVDGINSQGTNAEDNLSLRDDNNQGQDSLDHVAPANLDALQQKHFLCFYCPKTIEQQNNVESGGRVNKIVQNGESRRAKEDRLWKKAQESMNKAIRSFDENK